MNTQQMKATVTRRDPLTEVVDYDLLRVAFTLMVDKQDRNYWDTVRIPERPQGTVPFESVRQGATFLVPFVGFVVTWLKLGMAMAFMAIPVLLIAGYLLDRQLTAAIKAQQKRDMARDRGRYAATQLFCERLGLKPEEVTLSMVIKMSDDFMKVDTARREQEAREAEAREAAEKARARIAAGAYPSRNSYHRRNRQSQAPRYAAAYVAQDQDTYDTGEAHTFAPSVNPATGFQMIDSTLDVGGNIYGTDSAMPHHD